MSIASLVSKLQLASNPIGKSSDHVPKPSLSYPIPNLKLNITEHFLNLMPLKTETAKSITNMMKNRISEINLEKTKRYQVYNIQTYQIAMDFSHVNEKSVKLEIES